MKNKILAVSLILALLLTVGCGSKDPGEQKQTSDAATAAPDSTAEPELTIPDYGLDLEGADFNIL